MSEISVKFALDRDGGRGSDHAGQTPPGDRDDRHDPRRPQRDTPTRTVDPAPSPSDRPSEPGRRRPARAATAPQAPVGRRSAHHAAAAGRAAGHRSPDHARPAGDRRHPAGLGRLHPGDGALAVRQPRLSGHAVHVRDGDLRRDHVVPDVLVADVPGRPAGRALPFARPPAGAARGHRRLVRHRAADDDRAGAVATAKRSRPSARRCCRPRCRSTRTCASSCCSTTRRTRARPSTSSCSRQARALAAELTEWLAEPRERFARLLERVRAGQPGRRRSDAGPDGRPRRPNTAGPPPGSIGAPTPSPTTTTSTRSSPTRCCARWPTTSPPSQRALDRRDRGRRDAAAGAHAATAPAPGLDVSGRADLVRAQALRVAVARVEQGDEHQQLPRPDGTQLRAAAGRDRRPGPAARPPTPARSRSRTPTTS